MGGIKGLLRQFIGAAALPLNGFGCYRAAVF